MRVGMASYVYIYVVNIISLYHYIIIYGLNILTLFGSFTVHCSSNL